MNGKKNATIAIKETTIPIIRGARIPFILHTSFSFCSAFRAELIGMIQICILITTIAADLSFRALCSTFSTELATIIYC